LSCSALGTDVDVSFAVIAACNCAVFELSGGWVDTFSWRKFVSGDAGAGSLVEDVFGAILSAGLADGEVFFALGAVDVLASLDLSGGWVSSGSGRHGRWGLAGAGGSVEVLVGRGGVASLADSVVFSAAHTVGVFARLDVSGFRVDAEAVSDASGVGAGACDGVEELAGLALGADGVVFGAVRAARVFAVSDLSGGLVESAAGWKGLGRVAGAGSGVQDVRGGVLSAPGAHSGVFSADGAAGVSAGFDGSGLRVVAFAFRQLSRGDAGSADSVEELVGGLLVALSAASDVLFAVDAVLVFAGLDLAGRVSRVHTEAGRDVSRLDALAGLRVQEPEGGRCLALAAGPGVVAARRAVGVDARLDFAGHWVESKAFLAGSSDDTNAGSPVRAESESFETAVAESEVGDAADTVGDCAEVDGVLSSVEAVGLGSGELVGALLRVDELVLGAGREHASRLVGVDLDNPTPPSSGRFDGSDEGGRLSISETNR